VNYLLIIDFEMLNKKAVNKSIQIVISIGLLIFSIIFLIGGKFLLFYSTLLLSIINFRYYYKDKINNNDKIEKILHYVTRIGYIIFIILLIFTYVINKI